MKQLFLARHSDYDEQTGRINKNGESQMENLGRAIKQVLCSNSAYLLSSTAPRAIDGSEVLRVQLGLPSEFEKMAYLWCTSDNLDLNNYEWDLNRSESLMRIINERRERADGLIIVSHLEISGFSEYFFQKEFGQRERAKTIRQGCAAHIDLEKRTCQIIPQ